MSEEHLTSPGSTLGTVALCRPEQVRAKELDVRSDLFSLRRCAVRDGNGRHCPFVGKASVWIFHAILELTGSSGAIDPDLPPKLEDIITKASKKPAIFAIKSQRRWC